MGATSVITEEFGPRVRLYIPICRCYTTSRNGLAFMNSAVFATSATIQSIKKWTFVRWSRSAVGRLTLLTKVETSCDRILIAGGANVEAEWEQGPAV